MDQVPESPQDIVERVGQLRRVTATYRSRYGPTLELRSLAKTEDRIDEARRRLITEMERARKEKVKILKIVHGWGSTGEGGTLGPAIRKSLRLRVKEGKATFVVPGERFSSDANDGRELVQRHPGVRRDIDFNRANPGITIVEL